MYKAWVLMDNKNSVITEEYDTPEKAIAERGYTETENYWYENFVHDEVE